MFIFTDSSQIPTRQMLLQALQDEIRSGRHRMEENDILRENQAILLGFPEAAINQDIIEAIIIDSVIRVAAESYYRSRHTYLSENTDTPAIKPQPISEAELMARLQHSLKVTQGFQTDDFNKWQFIALKSLIEKYPNQIFSATTLTWLKDDKSILFVPKQSNELKSKSKTVKAESDFSNDSPKRG